VNRPPSVIGRLAADIEALHLVFDSAQQDAAGRLDRLAASLAASRRPRWFPARRRTPAAAPLGVYLWGGVGRGKTHLMDLFYDALPFAERERHHFYEFMQAVHRELRASAEREDPLEEVAARIARRARVVCLDEFQVQDIADAMILAGLLAGLFRRGVSLVLTSNRAPRDLYPDGLQRQRFLPAIALLEAHLDVLHLPGTVDYRQRQLARATVYWDSARANSEAEMRDLFDSLHGGAATNATTSAATSATTSAATNATTAAALGAPTVTIRSRKIAALAVCPGYVWFEFAALCETARSADDYLELAGAYRGVFVSHVPVFTAADDDAARRFVMLIDALYDRGVALIVSAAAEPAALYRGDRLRFEFERAASRLVEMRSQQYLARDASDPA
jgi:cell division protein ZapE